MKYLIIGVGGVGGSLAAYMYKAGLDVTVALRSPRYGIISGSGLIFSEAGHPEETLRIKTIRSEDISPEYDAVFLCVKDYSLYSASELLGNLAANCIVIPIMNGLTGAEKLRVRFGSLQICDACAYLSAGKPDNNRIVKLDKGFKIILQDLHLPKLVQLVDDLSLSGIKVKLSENIIYDKFLKFFFISPLSAAQAFYSMTSGELRSNPECREMFCALSRELRDIALASKIPLPENCVEKNIERLYLMPESSIASMASDYMHGRKYEREIMIDDVIRMGQSVNTSTKNYSAVAKYLDLHQRRSDKNG